VADDETAGAPRVVILSDRLWTRRYSGDSTILGRTISLDGELHEVRGIMPATFDNVVDPAADIWRPLRYNATQPWACRTCRHLRMIVRAREGVPLATVEHELDALADAFLPDQRSGERAGGQSADRAVALRCCRDHRRKPHSAR
jgi:putative ABC transport system permease protein